MQKDNGSSVPSTPSGPTARLRRRRGSNEVPPGVDVANGSHLLVNDRNKYKLMLIRIYSSVWMIGGFAFIIYLGHLYIWAMIVVIQIFMAKELFDLLRRAHENRRLPGFRLLNWHFFFTVMLFVYGRILSQRLVNTVTTDKFLYKFVSRFIKYHMFTCYLKIKDFGDSIPGHGGITDRMDCQRWLWLFLHISITSRSLHLKAYQSR